ncbi:hypothetical protein C0584_04840 [Candidatus Parcubacteria bacterium]|nr:MAG: hypothetical protein C0584_04840 [Candidatus Parcubacteria bacterium]
MKFLKTQFKLLVLIILVLGLSISLQSLLAAWTPPSSSAPNNNVYKPIDTSIDYQEKLGNVSLASDLGVGRDLTVSERMAINTSTSSISRLSIRDTAGGPDVYLEGLASNPEIALGDATTHWGIYSDTDAGNTDDLRFWWGTNAGVGNDLFTLTNTGSLHVKEICDESGSNCNQISSLGGTDLWTLSGTNAYFNTGNIGIGTTNPTTRLEVEGTIKASATMGTTYGPSTDYNDAGACSNESDDGESINYCNSVELGDVLDDTCDGDMNNQYVCGSSAKVCTDTYNVYWEVIAGSSNDILHWTQRTVTCSGPVAILDGNVEMNLDNDIIFSDSTKIESADLGPFEALSISSEVIQLTATDSSGVRVNWSLNSGDITTSKVKTDSYCDSTGTKCFNPTNGWGEQFCVLPKKELVCDGVTVDVSQRDPLCLFPPDITKNTFPYYAKSGEEIWRETCESAGLEYGTSIHCQNGEFIQTVFDEEFPLPVPNYKTCIPKN